MSNAVTTATVRRVAGTLSPSSSRTLPLMLLVPTASVGQEAVLAAA